MQPTPLLVFVCARCMVNAVAGINTRFPINKKRKFRSLILSIGDSKFRADVQSWIPEIYGSYCPDCLFHWLTCFRFVSLLHLVGIYK